MGDSVAKQDRHAGSSPHLPLSKDRRETLALLVVGMVIPRTVNLSHIASERPGTALVASTYRRLQRFFQHVELGEDWSAPVAAKLLGLQGSWTLVLDRTQWRVGEQDVNFLVLAVVTPRFRVPLMWSVIKGPGCSDTEQRIALMQRYLALFDVSTIRLLLADRELVGAKWLSFLAKVGIPFAIRLRENLREGLRVVSEAGHDLPLAAHLGDRGRTRFLRGRVAGMEADAPLLNFALKRLEDQLLIVVTNGPARAGLAAYAKRWAIESLFGDLKTRGLNIKDTRLTDPRKLDLLMSLAALATAWIARAAIARIWPRKPRTASHGYLAKSWFRIGFDIIRQLLRSDPARRRQQLAKDRRRTRQTAESRVVWPRTAAHE